MYHYLKYMGLTLMVLSITSPAFAYRECVGGIEITTNVYGTAGAPEGCTPTTCPSPARTFCVNDKVMNWWTAVAWCQSNGGELVDLEDICPGLGAPNDGDPCYTITGASQWGWGLWTTLVQGNQAWFSQPYAPYRVYRSDLKTIGSRSPHAICK